MRNITSHEVPGAASNLGINVLDEPGQGGANHCPPEAVAGLEQMAQFAKKAVQEGAIRIDMNEDPDFPRAHLIEVPDSSPNILSAGARFLKFAAEIQRISNSYEFGGESAIDQMRAALNEALENAELV